MQIRYCRIRLNLEADMKRREFITLVGGVAGGGAGLRSGKLIYGAACLGSLRDA